MRSRGGHIETTYHPATHAGLDRTALSRYLCRGSLWQSLGLVWEEQTQITDLQVQTPLGTPWMKYLQHAAGLRV